MKIMMYHNPLTKSAYLLRFLSLAGLFLFGGCNSTTVLLSNFKNDTIGSPPGATQPTGTVSVSPGAGSITVVAAPNPDLPSNKWAHISHPTAPAAETTLTGDFEGQTGIGSYSLIASMYIPAGAGVVTVQFETLVSPQPHLSFFHIDFMPEGDVRIDDGSVTFGHFPRDQSFVIQVNLNITQTTATAEVTLLGGEASGNTTVNIQPVFLPLARQFGAVRFWVGFQHEASFFVDDILVTRKK
jgi:hypothetical protein